MRAGKRDFLFATEQNHQSGTSCSVPGGASSSDPADTDDPDALPPATVLDLVARRATKNAAATATATATTAIDAMTPGPSPLPPPLPEPPASLGDPSDPPLTLLTEPRVGAADDGAAVDDLFAGGADEGATMGSATVGIVAGATGGFAFNGALVGAIESALVGATGETSWQPPLTASHGQTVANTAILLPSLDPIKMS